MATSHSLTEGHLLRLVQESDYRHGKTMGTTTKFLENTLSGELMMLPNKHGPSFIVNHIDNGG